jgi:aldehyde dehydrogenase (NAD+)
LRRLLTNLGKFETDICNALAADLGKSRFESYGAEVGFCREEIRYALRHLSAWGRPQRVPSPLVVQVSNSRIISEPKGSVLVISPWNYPFQLTIAPLISALAAGNCVILKPSEIAKNTSVVLAHLIEETFDKELVALLNGGREIATALLKLPFNHIFFTGSPRVGKIVMEAASKQLTPVTLELGGKSPCFVDKHIDIEVTARRLMWGKCYNAGQTCVAPDYLLVHKDVKDPLIAACQKTLVEFFGSEIETSPDYPRIINLAHFDRLQGLIGQGDILFGGRNHRDDLFMEPTLLSPKDLEGPLMKEEIFGPLLPVIPYESLDQALAVAKANPSPLATYVFTKDATVEGKILEQFSFGGGCINNTLMHLASPSLPFGGLGNSGIGSYHGKFGFDTFSHKKGILKTSWFPDLSLRYPPYGKKLGLLKWLMR